ncbi:hypothetical protein CLAFUW4_03472 [Fulvia fulva]|uniref:Uncharacterized protein n=1 Tax=Passalora fulva TaxID=5499 RepID=A0A9Q8LCB9_PASFU|nr:uncharacterized protein CLAFUR5_03451 [Fulvia fulva]KAK4631421.1 hypothetical protein CLAFUR4_03461 [Fulvia fulva]KAK4633778.1 hypothetical protein CLAFUR0_03466 [Fulvia fulva]UJO14138.1 hypothetical protein CLAFUR5_03451 [Fulvia fulva]WPV10769.1 hypothetical protein CLAFUW4_03472 [Fulvia fulva]WPV26713.1 hypothetical protein CLAFUW7_03464 [Fulvia fulva]
MSHRHTHHHDSHRSSKYTIDYKDLSKADVVQLASIAAPIPPPGTSAAACYHDDIKKRIADLPAHLQAKYPLMTSSCSTHKKVNPLPLDSILGVTQDEVSLKALERWTDIRGNDFVDSLPIALLQDMNAIWLKPTHFRQTFGRDPSPSCIWSFLDTKCVVCKLGHIAQSGPAVTALGALTIAGLRPENWKKSKRVHFFEEMLRSCVEFSYKEEPAILGMWECGSRLRAAREANKSVDPHGPRDYIDKFVEQARSSTAGSPHRSSAVNSNPPFELHPAPNSRPVAGPSCMPALGDYKFRSRPVRPDRSLSQEDHVKVTNAMVQDTPDSWAQTPTSASSTAPLIQPLRSPAQEEYAPFADTSPFASEGHVRMSAVQREFYAEAKTVSQEYRIRNPFEDEPVDRSTQNYSRASVRPQSLSVERPTKRAPIPSSIYSRPQTAATIDENAVIEMYRNGGYAGPSSGVLK